VCLSPQLWFEVIKETPAEELTEANCRVIDTQLLKTVAD